MKTALALLLALSGIASAAPFAQKWRVAGCPDLSWHHTATEDVAVDRKAKKIVRRERATGAMLKTLPLEVKTKTVYVAEAAGDTLLLKDKDRLTGVDAATGKKRFAAKGTRAIRLGEDFAITTEAKGKVSVQRLSGKTGEKAWSAEVAGAGQLYSFANDEGHVVVGIADAKAPAFTVAVIDAASGKVTWTTTLPIKSYYGAAITNGAVVVEERLDSTQSSAFHILDAAAGKLVAKVVYKNASGPVVGGGRLFVGANDIEKKTGAIAAIDVKTGKTVWTTPMPVVGSLDGVSGAGLLHHANGMLQTFDVGTGKLVASFGVPELNWLQLGERPLATLCDGKETLALDVGGAAETAKVTGKILCPDCGDSVIPFHIGETKGKTDDKGAFTATVVGAGRFEVVVDLEADGNVIGGAGKFVTLGGKGAYDLGTITVAPSHEGD